MLKTFSQRNPSQNEFELRSFIKLLQDRGCTSILEIGSREGDTMHEILCSLPVGSRGVSVDLPGGLWGKLTTGAKLKAAVADLVRRGYQASYILGDSTDPQLVASIHEMKAFDAILIDGDHRYKGVKADWANYGTRGRIIAFHDIVGHEQSEKVHGNQVEVPRLWAEIKAQNETIEFIEQDSKMGIGVVLPSARRT